MKLSVRELRETTGMSQKAFASAYGIPVSTLRKWEQGEASPAPYVIRLLAGSLPAVNSALQEITGMNGTVYYYDPNRMAVMDAIGNMIYITEGIENVKPENLPVYLRELFDGFYAIRDKFDRDCRFDKEEDIIWS